MKVVSPDRLYSAGVETKCPKCGFVGTVVNPAISAQFTRKVFNDSKLEAILDTLN
jgi:phage FluMu protein Com